jgi:TetR/AcrR family transcriptional regulator
MSYIAERRQEEKDRRRSDIVDAAEEVFARVGFEAATMESVARQARLSRALLYVYFKDKSDLHFAISERALTLLRERFEAAAARHSVGLEKVAAIGRAYVAFAHEVPHYFAAMARFEAHHPSEIEQGSQEHQCLLAGDSLHQTIVNAIEAGIADGSIRRDIGNPYLMSVTLWALMHGIIQLIATKANVFAADGISGQMLIDSAILLAGRAMQPPSLS